MGRLVNPTVPEAGYKSKQQFETTGSIAASDFAVVDNLDNSKKVVFDTSLVTATGTTVTIQVPASGTVTLVSGSDFVNPMTTGGDLIYGDALGVATRLGNGSAGQILVSAGGTAAPAWGLASSTSGTRNLWFGNSGAASLSTGTDNTCVGASAGAALTTGIKNVALGNSAGTTNTTHNSTTCVGYNSGSNNEANDNTFIGATAGQGTTSGSQNSYVGSVAGPQGGAGTGASNSALGYGAMNSLGSGSRNVAVGAASMNVASTTADMTAVGYHAATIATGAQCTFVGSGADNASAAYTNAIAIGYQASAPGSNTTVIGNSSTTQFIPKGVVVLSNTTQTLTTGGTVSSSTSYLSLSAASAIPTSTSTVITAGLATGQILQITNVGANTITFKSGGNTDLPGLTDYALIASSCISFVWDTATWYCTGVSVN